jgi:hypothetical protein
VYNRRHNQIAGTSRKNTYKNQNERNKCFHWTNLQTLECLKNLEKKATQYIKEIIAHQIKICEFIIKIGLKSRGDYTLLNCSKMKYV